MSARRTRICVASCALRQEGAVLNKAGRRARSLAPSPAVDQPHEDGENGADRKSDQNAFQRIPDRQSENKAEQQE